MKIEINVLTKQNNWSFTTKHSEILNDILGFKMYSHADINKELI